MTLKKYILETNALIIEADKPLREDFNVEKLRSSSGEPSIDQFKTLREVKERGVSMLAEDIFNKMENVEYDETIFKVMIKRVMTAYIENDDAVKNKTKELFFHYITDIKNEFEKIEERLGDYLSFNDIFSEMKNKNKVEFIKSLGDGKFEIGNINTIEESDRLFEKIYHVISHTFYLEFFRDEILYYLPKYILYQEEVTTMFDTMDRGKDTIDGKECIQVKRIMTLEDVDSLDNNVGIFWTWNVYNDSVHGQSNLPYLYNLKGYMPVESVDWAYTIITAFWAFSDENEVRGFHDGIVYINEISLFADRTNRKAIDGIQRRLKSVFFDDKKYDNPEYDSIMTKKLRRVADQNDGVISLKRYAKFRM